MNETQTEQPLAVIRPQEPLLAVIERAARDPAIDVGKMEKLLELAERVHVRQAEAEYDSAMNAAQGEMRPIATDSDNPQTRSRYASYGALDRAVRPVYSAHGFSLSFGTRSVGVDRVTVICRVSHRAGHTERVEIDMPADGKGAKGGDVMTKTHATGSAVSYGMRYLLKMIFNLAIGEYDDDGNSAGKRSAASSPRPATSTPTATKNPVVTPSKPNGGPREATEETKKWMFRELGSYAPDLLLEYAVKSGTLLPTEDLSDWPLNKVPTSKEALQALMKSIEEFRDGGTPPPSAGTRNADDEPDDVPYDPEEWRNFPMPFGKHSGTKLEDLDKKYLYGLAMNFTVETTYEGKPRSEKQIQNDRQLRAYLDDAAKHYQFVKKN